MLLGPKRDGYGEGGFRSRGDPRGRQQLSYLQPACVDSPAIGGFEPAPGSDFTKACCPAGPVLSQFLGSAGAGVTSCGGWRAWVQIPTLTVYTSEHLFPSSLSGVANAYLTGQVHSQCLVRTVPLFLDTGSPHWLIQGGLLPGLVNGVE